MNRRMISLSALLWLLVAPLVMAAAPCPPNLPVSPNAITVQGASPDGLTGYPLSVVGACPFDVIIDSALSSVCVTQCTNPWITSGIADRTGTATFNADGQHQDFDCTGYTVVVVETTVAGMTNVNSHIRFLTSLDGVNFSERYILPNQGTPQFLITQPGDFVGEIYQIPVGGCVKLRASSDFNNPGENWTGSFRFSVNRSISDMLASSLLLGNYTSLLEDGHFPFVPPAVGGTTDPGGFVSFPVLNEVFNGGLYDRQRTPFVFKSATATAAGSTALWTPAAGKKFRLMRYQVIVTDNATQAVTGTDTIELLDGAGHIGQIHPVFVPAVALLNAGSLYTSPWVDLGNGVLSSAANNVLNINLSTALTGGQVQVNACGTEE